MALATAKNKMDYLNTHGTSTPVGDITELRGVGEAFGAEVPKISSTKSLSGHPLGAASVHEAIYSLIMMKNSFITASANITDMDDEAKKFPIVTKTETDVKLNSVMSNSFGFGGTNAFVPPNPKLLDITEFNLTSVSVLVTIGNFLASSSMSVILAEAVMKLFFIMIKL